MTHQTESANENPWRVFCSIDLPAEVRGRVADHISRLKHTVPEIQASWSRPENIHLTLKFIGEIPQTRVERLSEATSRAVTGIGPFKLKIEQTGTFPTHGPPRVLWIGINDCDGKLDELYARLEAECAREGFKKEPRRYHPHLTLARIRKPHGARRLATAHHELKFNPAELVASELLVGRSELSRNGSKYTIISRHALTLNKRRTPRSALTI